MPSIQDRMEFEQKGIGEALSRGFLEVPLNQREYSWEEEHVDDLFKDFSGAFARDKSHFLGTIVLTRNGGEIPQVTDGQQRLATTTILLAAIRDWFHWRGEVEQANSIETEFLWKFDRRENTIVPRLRLNVDDKDFFVQRILPNPDTPERRRAQPSKDSHKLIVRAAEMATEHVRDIVKQHNGQMQKNELIRWVDFINTEAQVIVLNVPDDVDAFLMFETLNDRGLKASQADLLKNYLLREAGDRIGEAQQKWAQMTAVLQSLGQDDITVTYLHHLLITLHGPLRAAEIFNKVKDTVSGPTQALRFLHDAAEGANDYAALGNPDHPKWNDYDTSTRRHISTINRDLRVQQIRPLMLAVARHFNVRESQKAFRLFVYWSVRFLVVGGRGGLLDRRYSIAAQEVGNVIVKTAKELTDLLLDAIPSDPLFEATFSEVRVSASYLARYYLRALEQKYKGEPEPEFVPSDDEIAINLEHALPENPQDLWHNIPAETAKAYYRRVGNMVLLKAKKNSEIGNSTFGRKREAFAASQFSLTSMVAKYDDWGPDEIEERQRILAQWAVKTWPIQIQ